MTIMTMITNYVLLWGGCNFMDFGFVLSVIFIFLVVFLNLTR